MTEHNARAILKLRELFSFPETKPDVPFDAGGWLQPENAEVLKSFLSINTQVVLEVGTWYGLSARNICDIAPNATIVCIDTWLGSFEHIMAGMRVSTLFEIFLSSCWDYRQRIVPVRVDSYTGLKISNHFGLRPELVYIDGGHEHRTVYNDIMSTIDYFPETIIVGDDLDWPSVAGAVKDTTEATGKKVYFKGHCWWLE